MSKHCVTMPCDVLADTSLSPTDKAVFLAVATLYNTKDESKCCYASQETIGQRCGLERKAVARSIKKLLEKRLLLPSPQKPNAIRLNMKLFNEENSCGKHVENSHSCCGKNVENACECTPEVHENVPQRDTNNIINNVTVKANCNVNKKTVNLSLREQAEKVKTALLSIFCEDRDGIMRYGKPTNQHIYACKELANKILTFAREIRGRPEIVAERMYAVFKDIRQDNDFWGRHAITPQTMLKAYEDILQYAKDEIAQRRDVKEAVAKYASR